MGSVLGSKIIFVDGLPGSGKSTTAESIAGALEQRGIPCRLLREREKDHPLNVGGDLHPSGSTTGVGMFRAYTVGSFVEESLMRWDAFVAEAGDSERVNVLDSYPFQNSVRVLSQMDADPVTLSAYQSAVEAKAAGLGPVLIYLDPGDAERAVRAIAEQRGPAWTDYVIAVVTNCPYASSVFGAWTESWRSCGPTSTCSTNQSRDFHSRSSSCRTAPAAGQNVTRGCWGFSVDIFSRTLRESTCRCPIGATSNRGPRTRGEVGTCSTGGAARGAAG